MYCMSSYKLKSNRQLGTIGGWKPVKRSVLNRKKRKMLWKQAKLARKLYGIFPASKSGSRRVNSLLTGK